MENVTYSNIGMFCVLISCATMPAYTAQRPVTMADIQALEAQLAELKARLIAQSSDSQSIQAVKRPKAKDKTRAVSALHSTTQVEPKREKEVRVYATVRPTFGLIDEQDESNLDVRDALSHAGIKAVHEFQPGWRAELHGEWSIDLANEGNFGRSRRAYTALSTPYGRFGIGKQRPAQYLFIAEYVDIFNHGASPFAYDPESIFFVDNLVTYRYETGPVTFIAVGQFDGKEGDNQADLINIGLSYDKNGIHAAVTYQHNTAYEQEQKLGDSTLWSGALAYQFTDDFYAALAYQAKEYDYFTGNRDGHTFDMSMAYQLTKHYKLKAGFFDFDDGHISLDPNNQSFDGYNLTLEWLPVDSLRLHLEYLTKSFDNKNEFDSISVGFRYDFSTKWQYE
ncbi:porin [Pseudoalteromonas sp. MMG005]|uniref:porin n=1 Tax=Pseudoalteromonas sp. MMG005 TaxID=2822682 RepID=UPI001B3A492D|nr:porin [Pseudoalteromonas sp. MMG005]MBQ4845101.1 porin [Pseudoalteromonas sp. MMG005]